MTVQAGKKPEQAPVLASRRRRAELASTPPPARGPRRLTIGLGSIVSVLLLMAMLAAWGAGTTFWLLTGDQLAQTLIVQNTEMQDAYEQRLQAFRAEIARLTLEMEQSKFDSGSVEGRIVDLGRRQRQIELRLEALYRLADLVAPGSVGSAPPPPSAAPPPAPPARPPSGNRGSYEFAPPPVQVAALGQTDIAQLSPPAGVELSPVQTEVETFIQRLDSALKRSAKMQEDVLTLLYQVTETRAARFRAALSEIGMSEEVVAQKTQTAAVIPAIILPISEQATPFAQRINQVRQNFALTYRIRYIIEALPIIKPTPDEIRYSSGFGFRFHPIHHVQRLHAGIDMAAPIGTPVRAAGSGVVLSAGWGGGYGNLVQIDHGNGLISRYAHLSQINVTAGQPISAGAPVGLMGTTGASTGSHLHFETRIHGNPVNPACFMHAGDRIRGRSTVPLTCDTKPTWTTTTSKEEEDDDS